MSAGAGLSRPYIPPPASRPTVPPREPTKPSLRWRLRRWLLKKLDAWPREKPEPTTEWGRMRREERRLLFEEVERLRQFEGDRRVLIVALKPFARGACRPLCGECHYCAASAALQSVTEAP